MPSIPAAKWPTRVTEAARVVSEVSFFFAGTMLLGRAASGGVSAAEARQMAAQTLCTAFVLALLCDGKAVWSAATRGPHALLSQIRVSLVGGAGPGWKEASHTVKRSRIGVCTTVSGTRRLYSVDVGALPSALSQRYVPLELDSAALACMRSHASTPAWRLRLRASVSTWLQTRLGLSRVDALGLVGGGEMFLISTAHARALLRLDSGERLPALLDIGAGAGSVTAQLAPLFDAVVATEESGSMCRRLHARGFAVHHGTTLERLAASAGAQGVDAFAIQAAGTRTRERGGASVVALLNVLDRCDEPRRLLREAGAALAPDGLLLLAVVLPFLPAVEDTSTAAPAGSTRPPRHSLGLPETGSFEASASALWSKVLQPEGWSLEAFSRVPYLSAGDPHCHTYTLDAAIWVLRRCRPT